MFTVKENKWGRVTVEDDVIATLAGMAAMSCYGLVGMAARNIQSGLSSLLGLDAMRKGVTVSETEEGLIVEVAVIVGYGIPISEVSYNVGQKVKHELEGNAGIPVAKVNVNIMGVRVIKDK
ncbi:MAG: Asp23/Gls24 family envelope stress response protein [Syntrophomonadaceae bacterium]|nr:Asp23/Gls24 family envelope stress response protein [Syntrophomonadaceae bacterium]